MKPVLILSLYILVVTSCKKNYVCTCNDPTRSNTLINQYTFNERTKGEADLKCLTKQSEYNKLAMYGYVSCTVK
jgi:hypothetical protein